MDLTQILLGSLLLSALHAFVPNHWIPLVAIGRAQRWSRSRTLLTTAVAGLAHVTSTILIGIAAGLLGYRFSARFASVTSIVAPALLIGMGLVYLAWDLAAGRRPHVHFEDRGDTRSRSNLSLVGSLCVAMFFSPCVEIEAYYFAAGAVGWRGVALVSSIYLLVTVAGMVALVDLGLRGARRIRSRFLEQHEKRVTGLVLVSLGFAACFVAY